MWKANEKTTTLQLFLDSLSPKTEKLSLEGTMDLSRDRLILELDAVEGDSSGMIYISSSMKIGTGVQAILRFRLTNLRGCDVCITDDR
jgi:hypothetical protein